MAQFYYPLHITGDDRVPALLGGTNAINTFIASSQTNTGFGAASGPSNFGSLDDTTHDKVLRCELTDDTERLVLTTNDSYTDIDAVLRFRTLSSTAADSAVGILARLNRHAQGALNGYGVWAYAAADYRNILYARAIGTTTTSYAGIDVRTDFSGVQSDVATFYRYLRLKVSGSTINLYSWWEGDNAAAIAKTHSITDTTYNGAGKVGFIIYGNGIYDLDFLSIGTGTDNAPLSPSLTEFNGVVYEPTVDNNSTVPALRYPVRAYHRASGALAGYKTSSATDGTFRIAGLRYGQTASVLNAIDNDGDTDRWGHAISAPVTPDLS